MSDKSLSVFNGRDLGVINCTDEVETFLRPIVPIINELSCMARLANFWMTVRFHNGNPTNIQMASLIEPDVMPQAAFIGIYTLAVCGNQIESFNNEKGDARLKTCLFERTKEAFGDEGLDQLKAWMVGINLSRDWEPVPEHKCSKLGGLTHSIEFLHKFDMQDIAHLRIDWPEILTGIGVIAESTKGVSPALDAMLKRRMDFVQRAFMDMGPAAFTPAP